MRVAIATESYWPDVNGVANSVVQVARHLRRRGHEALVIAPRPAPRRDPAPSPPDLPAVRLPAIGLPGYRGVRMALPGRAVAAVLRAYQPDVVHLASPFVLGAWTVAAAGRLGVPVVAVFQTDLPGYARVYGLRAGEDLAWRWIRRVHARAELTLAPSSAAAEQLAAHGVGRVGRWGRGVDLELFTPARRRDTVRRCLAPDGEILVGYVGRLAREKCVELLGGVCELPGVRVVVVGDGPVRGELERAMPRARFLGTRLGLELATLYASLDLFVHTGPHETFGQTVQEALASGVPVIAPAAGGPLDLVSHGHNGLLVPPGDAAALAGAVAMLAADDPLRRRYASQARASVGQRDWASTVDEIIGHYETVTGRTPRHLPGLARRPLG